MADWVPIYRKAFTDARVASLAQTCRVALPHVIGLCAALWLNVADHAPSDGKISDVTDGTIEEWAGWRGKRGRFAQAYRALFQTESGHIRNWDRYVGFMLDAMARERKRKRDAYLKARGLSAEKGAEKPADTPGKSRSGRDVVSQSGQSLPPKSPADAAADRGPSGAPAAAAGDLDVPDEATRNAQADRLRQLVVEAGVEVPPAVPALTPEKIAEIEAKRAAYKAVAAAAPATVAGTAIEPDADIGALLRTPGRT